MPEIYQKNLLALVAWREARNEGREGLRGVMHVIRNRVHAGWGDWEDVITRKNQFSSMTYTNDPQLTLWPSKEHAGWETFLNCLELANIVWDNSDPDITNGALYYGNLNAITSQWFKDNVIATMEMVAQIGNHTFYRPCPANIGPAPTTNTVAQ